MFHGGLRSVSTVRVARRGIGMFCSVVLGAMVVVGGAAGSALTASAKLTQPPGRSVLMVNASSARRSSSCRSRCSTPGYKS